MEPDYGSWQTPDISRSHLYRGTNAWSSGLHWLCEQASESSDEDDVSPFSRGQPGVGVGVGFNSNFNSRVGVGVEIRRVGVGVDIPENCQSWHWSWNLRSWSWSWSWYSGQLTGVWVKTPGVGVDILKLTQTLPFSELMIAIQSNTCVLMSVFHVLISSIVTVSSLHVQFSKCFWCLLFISFKIYTEDLWLITFSWFHQRLR